jgi:hypothetical protein
LQSGGWANQLVLNVEQIVWIAAWRRVDCDRNGLTGSNWIRNTRKCSPVVEIARLPRTRRIARR